MRGLLLLGLAAADLARLGATCTGWRRSAREPAAWQAQLERDFPERARLTRRAGKAHCADPRGEYAREVGRRKEAAEQAARREEEANAQMERNFRRWDDAQGDPLRAGGPFGRFPGGGLGGNFLCLRASSLLFNWRVV